MRNKSWINIDQHNYTLDILSNTCLLLCKPAFTLMARDAGLNTTNGTPLSDPSKCQRLVGQLIYFLNICPGISYYVQQLSQHMSKPIDVHYNVAICVLCYVKSSPAQGLFFPNTFWLQFKAFFTLIGQLVWKHEIRLQDFAFTWVII